jgi:MinD-like ATPase involved in chromosome partitioning or flagellar assembly
MYVITFYSFKGGVGRTMAMVNAAAQLVKSGRNVLLVDFDLEAPGLDAFPLLRPEESVPGMVEYVTDYLSTGCAPPVANYVSSCASFGKGPGRLWTMPSGIRNHTYSSRLQAINWQNLYSERHGYLLFEDLKAQWESYLKPDYVLVDSRTGHTDVGGICTRQLPDAVVLSFLPNEENIRGLESIVAEIRQENEGPLQKQIEILFVPSNVPYLDDEEDILNRRLEEAEGRLGFVEPDATIHRYDSLALLDSEVFSITHPRSRLAREYEELATVMTARNLDDRGAALRLLSGDEAIIDPAIPGLRDLDSRLKKIRNAHGRDGEVIHHLGTFMQKLGRSEEAKKLLDEAANLGYRSVELMIDAANRFHAEGNVEAALVSLKEALNDSRATFLERSRAIRLAGRLDISVLGGFMSSSRFRDLQPSAQSALIDQMFVSRDALPLIEQTIRSLFPSHMTTDFRTHLMLSLIGQRKFDDAMKVLGSGRPDLALLHLPDAFNYAIAEWGASKHIPVDWFRRVVELIPVRQEILGRNVWQCFAIAHWASGNPVAALGFLAEAEALARQEENETFSCWRYFKVSPGQFLADLRSVRSMIEGADILPAVFESVG